MAYYFYNALDEQGQENSGYMEAEDKDFVVQQLRRQGLFVIDLEEQVVDDDADEQEDVLEDLARFIPVTSTQKVFFFKQMALMLRSGMSLTQALDVIVNLQSGRLRRVAADVNLRVKSGESFSSAMDNYRDLFSLLSVQMIRSAEATGEIDLALDRIADYLERQAALKKEVMSAMFYPAFTLLAAIGVFVFLLVYIIPKFENFLADTGRSVPPSTQLMIDLGDFIVGNWMVILVFMFLSLVGIVLVYRQPAGRLFMDHVMIRIPVLGKVIISAAMAQVSWALGMLLKSGVPIVQALRIISNMIGNKVIANSIGVATERVIHGQNMGNSFNQPFITKLIMQLISVGEKSGNLVPIMNEANSYYETDLQARTRRLANMVEPMAILLIGGIVGFIYYGFFKAILSLSSGGGI